MHYRQRCIHAIAIAIVLWPLTGFSSPATGNVVVSTASGQNGADAYIERTQPNANFGDVNEVCIKNDSGTGNVDRKGYFRFDLSAINETISGATLQMTLSFHSVNSVNSSYLVYGLNDLDSGEEWNELTTTWNNAPANITNSGTGLDAGRVTLLGTFFFEASTAEPGDVVEFTSEGLVSFLQSDTNNLVTLMVIRQQANLANECFASKEHKTFEPARLLLATGPTPIESSSWGEAKARYRK